MPAPQLTGRSSPPTLRVVAILDFLAANPTQQFGLSELARQAGMTKPTCLGILTALTDCGYLLRNARDKTYRLGPALIRLGQNAQEALRVGPAGTAELRRLSDELDVSVALTAVVDDRITVLEIAAPPRAQVGVRVGESYPFAPPVGLMYVLWDAAALRDWLDRRPTVPLRTDSARLERVVDDCRARGYLVERLTPGGQRLYRLMAGLASDLPEELQVLLGELVSDVGDRVYLRDEAEPRQRHDINVISAPVFDSHGRQAMVVSLHVDRALTDAQIAKWGRRLVATADTVTTQLGGHKPDWTDA